MLETQLDPFSTNIKILSIFFQNSPLFETDFEKESNNTKKQISYCKSSQKTFYSSIKKNLKL